MNNREETLVRFLEIKSKLRWSYKSLMMLFFHYFLF